MTILLIKLKISALEHEQVESRLESAFQATQFQVWPRLGLSTSRSVQSVEQASDFFSRSRESSQVKLSRAKATTHNSTVEWEK